MTLTLLLKYTNEKDKSYVENVYDLDDKSYWGMNLLSVAILYGRLECLDIMLRETQNQKHLWNSSNV